MFVTTDDLNKHILKEHKIHRWICDYCTDRDDKEHYNEIYVCDTSDAWVAHVMRKHLTNISRTQLENLAPLSRRDYVKPMECPICGFQVRDAQPELHPHIKEHLHSFALRALPWGILEGSQASNTAQFSPKFGSEESRNSSTWGLLGDSSKSGWSGHETPAIQNWHELPDIKHATAIRGTVVETWRQQVPRFTTTDAELPEVANSVPISDLTGHSDFVPESSLSGVTIQERVTHSARIESDSVAATPDAPEITDDSATAKPLLQLGTSNREPELHAHPECLMCKRTFDVESGAKPYATARELDGPVVDELGQLPPFPGPLPERHPRFELSTPPEYPKYSGHKSLHLAGSIEEGRAVPWQRQMELSLHDLPITITNPCREPWEVDRSQGSRDAALRHQTVWELSCLEKANLICFFFDANTVDVVPLMELGLWAASGKVIVCCDPRYWRAGNVHLVCERYQVPYVEKFEDLVTAVKEALMEDGLELDKHASLCDDSSLRTEPEHR